MKNTALAKCTLHGLPSAKIPRGNPSFPSYHPCHNHTLIIATNARVVGMGNPSKYLALPDASFGNEAAVTLNRARRESPERKKNARISESTVVRRPSVYASTDGATPNET
jgi:hypothetical protein